MCLVQLFGDSRVISFPWNTIFLRFSNFLEQANPATLGSYPYVSIKRFQSDSDYVTQIWSMEYGILHRIQV